MNAKLTSLAFFLATFVAETLSLVLLVGSVGSAFALGWMAITFVAGAGFMQQTPYRSREDVRLEVMKGRMDVVMALKHLLIAKAGVLLMLPGLVTDFVGLFLTVPKIREWVVRKMIKSGQVRLQSLDQDDNNFSP